MTNLTLPGLGPLAWIDVVLLGWFVLIGLSVLYIVIDIRRNPESIVMKWGWILVSLYMGPLAVGLYVLSDKEPRPGMHEAFIKPLWKQGVGSTIHCVAGDATGIILAATITGLFGLPMWFDLIAEYVFGFAFGLFIFQALFMKDMYGGSYRASLRHTFMPEWLSMNMMMAGMLPVMVLLMMGQDMRAMEPTELIYWGTMSLGIIVGFAVAYPINVWLVAVGLKHGLSTEGPRSIKDRSGDPGQPQPQNAAVGNTATLATSASPAVVSPVVQDANGKEHHHVTHEA
jgi:hypothetical protein